MSGPTGFNPDARTLVKVAIYELSAAPPGDYPAPANVFSGVATAWGTPPPAGTPPPVGFTAVNPVTNLPYTVLFPTWGGPPIVIGTPPR